MIIPCTCTCSCVLHVWRLHMLTGSSYDALNSSLEAYRSPRSKATSPRSPSVSMSPLTSRLHSLPDDEGAESRQTPGRRLQTADVISEVFGKCMSLLSACDLIKKIYFLLLSKSTHNNTDQWIPIPVGTKLYAVHYYLINSIKILTLQFIFCFLLAACRSESLGFNLGLFLRVLEKAVIFNMRLRYIRKIM